VGAQGRVLAVDRSAELVRHVSTRAAAEGLTHLETLAADITGELPLRTGSFDFCLLCTVLHSLGHEKRGRVLREAHRLLAPAGRLAVVEIKKEPMDFGPPLEQRLSEDELERLAADTGFRRILSTGLGPTHLGIFAAQ
jgi:ubiquinone/menaquinone biosynthesis C-methylase UbiE